MGKPRAALRQHGHRAGWFWMETPQISFCYLAKRFVGCAQTNKKESKTNKLIFQEETQPLPPPKMSVTSLSFGLESAHGVRLLLAKLLLKEGPETSPSRMFAPSRFVPQDITACLCFPRSSNIAGPLLGSAEPSPS